MIRLEPSSEGTILPVRAQPGARRVGITGEYDGALRIAVSAAPEKGKANKAIVKILADAFNLPKSAVEIVSGTTSRRKKFLLRSASSDSIYAVLKDVLGDTAS